MTRERRRTLPSWLLVLAATLAIPARAQTLDTSADFSFTPASPKAGDSVQFTDQSTGSVFGWYWSFGDGATDGTQDPVHAYASPGVFPVTLSVIDRNGNQFSASHTVTVSAGGTTTAAFSFTPVTPVVGQTVTFTDLSTGNPTAWAWDFGDGATSSLQNPTHAYAAAGTKNVKLTATAGSTSSSVTESVQVAASSLNASFAFFPSNPLVGQSISFNDTSKGGPTAWSWTFGDGAASTQQNPTHAYAAAGAWSVKLTVSGGGVSDSATKNVTVTTSPTGAFTARVKSLQEAGGPTANGDKVAEPGERAAAQVSVSNGTSRTEPAVVGLLVPKTPGITMIVDQVEYGNVAAGATAVPPGVPFEFFADPSVPCGATLSFDLRLSYGGLPTTSLPLTTKLGTVPCAPPKDVAPSVNLDDGQMQGAAYRIGSAIAYTFTGAGSVSISGYKIELSRDGGSTWATVSDGDFAYVGPHIASLVATGPVTTNARLRVTANLANGRTVSAASRNGFSITSDSTGAGVARLPVVVQTVGAQSTYFTTEVTVASVDRAAAVALTFTPVGGLPVTLPQPLLIRRGSRFFPDIFQTFRDQGLLVGAQGLVGTMTATVGGVPNPVLEARVVNIPASGVGTFGLSFLSRTEGAASSTEAWVSGLRTNGQFRSNLSFAHAGGGSHGPLTLKLQIFDAETGQEVSGSPSPVVLVPDGFLQVNNFQGFGVTSGGVYLCRVTRTAGDDQFRTYGTVIDGVTGDSSFVDGVAPYADGPATVHLASIVEAAGLFGSFFTSEATFVNRSATEAATVSLHLDTTSQGSFDIPGAFVLLPRHALLVPDVVQYFREHGAALTGTVVGPLRVTFSNGDGDVGVRTFSDRAQGQPSSGTYGLAFPGRRDDREAASGVLLVGARKSSAYRTNLALVNVGSAPVTLSYQLVTAAYYQATTPESVTLPPGGFFQVNDVIGSSGSGTTVPAPGDYFVLVTRTAGSGPWEAYLTVVDNVTNDGSFVEMSKM